MAETKGVKSIELKRVVMVKAIVTEAFKENLVRELERAVKNLDVELQRMEFQGKKYLEDLKKKGMGQQFNAFKQQLTNERTRQSAAKSDLLAKIEQAKALELNTEFIQGPIEGPVEVALGDNLYKKVGAAEVIVKDGIVQEIRGVD